MGDSPKWVKSKKRRKKKKKLVITMAKLRMAHKWRTHGARMAHASRLGQYAWRTQACMAHAWRLGQYASRTQAAWAKIYIYRKPSLSTIDKNEFQVTQLHVKHEFGM